ncbi:P-loop containing nucleoside triphosphate hydrolase protein [Polychytrium aggregatum]|uniref:P-loop containing nucleoside triphosphate hydrolase protein n=1 Tax=Polychytrium aggregatum TaxID=110093 RepID=UPI0022FE7240|nr:P-loop containing nucleoside triphosphate hydrolase protein [Polychytrium aggregatum]KAI9209218.1 P-loop containing nucleoside triphosphate hydrolase protein [Polychytrium aggregatum]
MSTPKKSKASKKSSGDGKQRPTPTKTPSGKSSRQPSEHIPEPIEKLPPVPIERFLVEPSTAVHENARPHHLRVYVHARDMAALGLAAGQLVQLTKDDPIKDAKNIVAISWPSSAPARGQIQIGNLLRQNGGLELGSYATIAPFLGSIWPCERLSIQPTADIGISLDEAFLVYAKEIMVDLKYIQDETLVEILYYGKHRQFRVRVLGRPHNQPESDIVVFHVARSTTLVLVPFSQPVKAEDSSTRISYDTIGGLSDQIKIVREMVEGPLHSPEKYTAIGLKPPRGLLLFGPPGTGKTLIARAVAAETGAHSIVVNGPEIISKFYGETEAKLRAVFEEAVDRAPSIVFIDEIDALCPNREESSSELEKRVVGTMLTLMDGASTSAEGDRVVVIGATNRPNALDSALRRPGRFDREIEIGIPNAQHRHEILQALLRRIPHDLTDNQLREIADVTHGYVGADLAAVLKEAGLKAIQRTVQDGGGQDLRIRYEEAMSALELVRPSTMREIMIEVPKVYWTDIGGQESVKQRLKEAIEWPLKHPHVFEYYGIKPPKGILLYGPPGCSKTLTAKALATEAKLNFIAVKGPELFSKWVGESEKAVQEIFKKARAASPSIVFFDEIDAIGVRRGGEDSVGDRVLSQLLGEMDGIEPLVNVTVVAATNRPDILDSALLRPGRFDRILYVAPPDLATRRDIFRIQLQKMPCAADVDLDELAQLTQGFSGAECVSVCQTAAMKAMEEDIGVDAVGRKHFADAARAVTPRITPEMLAFYDQFRSRSGLRSI